MHLLLSCANSDFLGFAGFGAGQRKLQYAMFKGRVYLLRFNLKGKLKGAFEVATSTLAAMVSYILSGGFYFPAPTNGQHIADNRNIGNVPQLP